MVDSEHLRKILNGALALSAKKIEINSLAGDASNRTYHRVSWEENGSARSLILMVMAAPEGFKASEEAVSGAPTEIAELPFINIQRHLHACKVAVPEILFYDAARGWMLLEDLGDITLAQVIQEKAAGNPAVLKEHYQKAIDTLLTIQADATAAPPNGCIAHHRAFDQALFVWEFDHFIEYGIEARTGTPIPQKQRDAIRAHFSDIALRLASLPQVFTHRDYHSRNLMIQTDPAGFAVRVIDFQDALMGPPQYDLASLLRDSYIDLPEQVIDDLIGYYLQRKEARSGERVPPEMFREYFDLVSIQRNLKAAGRFVYIDRVKQNPRFLQYIPPTLRKVKRNLEKHRRLAPLHALLAEYVEELQP
ncbi:MAG: phosphotransferase [Candidatus Manganitrophus sp. SA1]|nr:phosphotransferase [Candidatus Manganitrophus morganii]